jgi:hypothetical protein
MSRNLILKIWCSAGVIYGLQFLGLPEFTWNRLYNDESNGSNTNMTRFAGITLIGYSAAGLAILNHGSDQLKELFGKIGALEIELIL